jgi:hypothetical protein
MAEATDAEDKTSVVTATDNQDTSTDKAPKDKAEEPGKDSTPAAKDNDADGGADDAGDQGNDKADDSEAQKQRNREEYKLRVSQRETKELAQMRQNLDAWVDEAADDTERRTRRVEAKQYLSDVQHTQEDIARDNQEVAREIPLFNAASPEFRQDLLDRSLRRYARDCLDLDTNGVVVGYKMRLLDYMREEAEAYGVARSNTPEQKKQPSKKENRAKMDAAADTPGGTSPNGSKTKDEADDPFLKGFNDPYGRHSPENAHKWAGSRA